MKHSLRLALLSTAFGSICLAPTFADSLPRVADATGPRTEDRVITQAVQGFVAKHHISQHRLDDEISKRTFHIFLEGLDPYKLYFTADDFKEFAAHELTLDNEISRSDIRFAYDVYKRLLQRVAERMPLVHELIDAEYDFTQSEQILVEPDLIEYVNTPEEFKERWRKQIKYAFLSLRADKKTDDKIREQLHRRYRSIESYRNQEDVYELLEQYLTSMTMAFDPHTSYLAPRAEENFDILLGLQLQGIGATLGSEDGLVTIKGLVAGGAADKDGRLQEGDQIVAVGQEDSTEDIDVVDMKLDDVVSLIRGKAGTKVRLTIQPKVGGESKVIEITRAKIQLADSAARSTVIEHTAPSGDKIKVGYVRLPSFYLDMNAERVGEVGRSTTVDVREQLDKLRSENVDIVVLDLAKNGGGSLTEAIKCTGLFIDKGPVVQVKGSSGAPSPYEDEEAGVSWGGPLIVKTDKMSASASEILAGAIKDYGRGIVVGDPATHGKGTVQTMIDVNELLFGRAAKTSYGALKLTIQQFYLPDGESTQLNGVSADVVLPSIWANADIGEGDLDFALPSDRVPAQPHINYQMIDNNMRVELQQKSTSRVAESTDFRKLLTKIEAFKVQKDEKYKSLNEAEFLAKRAELDLQAEEEKQMEEVEGKSNEIFTDDYYNREVLNIAADYVEVLRKRDLAANR